MAYCGLLVSSGLFQSLVVYSSGQGGEGGADERTRQARGSFRSELISSNCSALTNNLVLEHPASAVCSSKPHSIFIIIWDSTTVPELALGTIDTTRIRFIHVQPTTYYFLGAWIDSLIVILYMH